MDRQRWELLDQAGTVVGRFGNGFEPPHGTRCRASEVLAVVEWSRDASEPQYRDTIKCDSWGVVMPELEFEPNGNPGPAGPSTQRAAGTDQEAGGPSPRSASSFRKLSPSISRNRDSRKMVLEDRNGAPVPWDPAIPPEFYVLALGF